MQTNTLCFMPVKLPLSPEQQADARRLMQAWQQWQNDQREAGRPFSQDEVSDKLGFGQSALSQYLTARIPLNTKTLAKFCALMGVRAADISPTIVEEERRRALAWEKVVGGGAVKAKGVGATSIRSGKLGSSHRVITGSGVKPAKSKDAKADKTKR